MFSQRLANIAFAAVLIAACGYFFYLAEQFVTSGLLASSGLPSKFFPQWTLLLMAVSAAVVAWQYLRRKKAPARGKGGPDKDGSVFARPDDGSLDEAEDVSVFVNGAEARRGLLMLVVAVACYGIWLVAGFLPMIVLVGPLSLLVMDVRSPWIYLTVFCLAALIYIVFTQVLGTQF